jgi:hypothetical protein
MMMGFRQAFEQKEQPVSLHPRGLGQFYAHLMLFWEVRLDKSLFDICLFRRPSSMMRV